MEEYGEFVYGKPEALEFSLSYLKSRLPHREVDRWRQLLERRELDRFAEQLLNKHYESLYERWRRKAGGSFWQVVRADDLASLEARLEQLLDPVFERASPLDPVVKPQER